MTGKPRETMNGREMFLSAARGAAAHISGFDIDCDQGADDMERNDLNEKKTTTVYLVRHGTTAWNQELRYQGQADNPLDEVGRSRAPALRITSGTSTWIWESQVRFSAP